MQSFYHLRVTTKEKRHNHIISFTIVPVYARRITIVLYYTIRFELVLTNVLFFYSQGIVSQYLLTDHPAVR